ncbi:Fe-S cluster assembly protein HesB [Streptomyces kaniharaensis]|uniref:Fe-S cluster assembly protein HesB n=1 Tax=Streptomyces kaniharaensis TaxID=212423 RepID=A0A6N7L2G3_9ACTN|nr:HhH-GPD-type base excision DNA repair protein [Streptomyces kaniharaensis]MQS16384.1 Fe-S cluster assembly protein HesB [Streptomyces kaniharaensis]
MDVAVRITQQPEADALLSCSALALLVGALLDRQVATDWAFAGPLTIAHRLGRKDLDVHQIASHSQEGFVALLAAGPAVHECPAVMARRIQEMCRFLIARYEGQAAAVWEGVSTGKQLYGRVNELPGFGRQKSQIFVALLGKQYGVRPEGWRDAAGNYGEDGVFRCVADITGPDSLEKVRAFRQEQRRVAKEVRVRTAGAVQRARVCPHLPKAGEFLARR